MSNEKHSLLYKLIFPEFRAVAVADDRQIAHYSKEDRSWNIDSQTADYIKDVLKPPPDSEYFFSNLYNSLSDCTNSPCSVNHTLQRIIGCKLEKYSDGTVNKTFLDEYAFDGEDFMSFGSENLQWIEKSIKAKEIKPIWDLQIIRNKSLYHYLKETCTDWISKFNNTKKNSPDVYIFARKSPDNHSKLNLTCLATGFYPRDIEMYIRLNESVLENQISSGVRPNDDETFQMRASVEIDRVYREFYDCHVIHSSLTEPVSAVLDGTCNDSEKGPQWYVIAAGAAVLALAVAAIGYIYKKKKPNGERRIDI